MKLNKPDKEFNEYINLPELGRTVLAKTTASGYPWREGAFYNLSQFNDKLSRIIFATTPTINYFSMIFEVREIIGWVELPEGAGEDD